MIRFDWLHLSRINTLHHFRCSTYFASDTKLWPAGVSPEGNWSPSWPNCGPFRRKAEDIVVSSSHRRGHSRSAPRHSFRRDRRPVEACVGEGSGGHIENHDRRATVAKRASSRVRSRLRLAAKGVAVLTAFDLGKTSASSIPSQVQNCSAAGRAASIQRHISSAI